MSEGSSTGKKLREAAIRMAKSPLGTSEIVRDVDGNFRTALKDEDGGILAGLDYSLESLGARAARGDEPTEDEINVLIEKARGSGLENPENLVRSTIKMWKRSTETSDKRSKDA